MDEMDSRDSVPTKQPSNKTRGDEAKGGGRASRKASRRAMRSLLSPPSTPLPQPALPPLLPRAPNGPRSACVKTSLNMFISPKRRPTPTRAPGRSRGHAHGGTRRHHTARSAPSLAETGSRFAGGDTSMERRGTPPTRHTNDSNPKVTRTSARVQTSPITTQTDSSHSSLEVINAKRTVSKVSEATWTTLPGDGGTLSVESLATAAATLYNWDPTLGLFMLQQPWNKDTQQSLVPYMPSMLPNFSVWPCYISPQESPGSPMANDVCRSCGLKRPPSGSKCRPPSTGRCVPRRLCSRARPRSPYCLSQRCPCTPRRNCSPAHRQCSPPRHPCSPNYAYRRRCVSPPCSPRSCTSRSGGPSCNSYTPPGCRTCSPHRCHSPCHPHTPLCRQIELSCRMRPRSRSPPCRGRSPAHRLYSPQCGSARRQRYVACAHYRPRPPCSTPPSPAQAVCVSPPCSAEHRSTQTGCCGARKGFGAPTPSCTTPSTPCLRSTRCEVYDTRSDSCCSDHRCGPPVSRTRSQRSLRCAAGDCTTAVRGRFGGAGSICGACARLPNCPATDQAAWIKFIMRFLQSDELNKAVRCWMQESLSGGSRCPRFGRTRRCGRRPSSSSLASCSDAPRCRPHLCTPGRPRSRSAFRLYRPRSRSVCRSRSPCRPCQPRTPPCRPCPPCRIRTPPPCRPRTPPPCNLRTPPSNPPPCAGAAQSCKSPCRPRTPPPCRPLPCRARTPPCCSRTQTSFPCTATCRSCSPVRPRTLVSKPVATCESHPSPCKPCDACKTESASQYVQTTPTPARPNSHSCWAHSSGDRSPDDTVLRDASSGGGSSSSSMVGVCFGHVPSPTSSSQSPCVHCATSMTPCAPPPTPCGPQPTACSSPPTPCGPPPTPCGPPPTPCGPPPTPCGPPPTPCGPPPTPCGLSNTPCVQQQQPCMQLRGCGLPRPCASTSQPCGTQFCGPQSCGSPTPQCGLPTCGSGGHLPCGTPPCCPAQTCESMCQRNCPLTQLSGPFRPPPIYYYHHTGGNNSQCCPTTYNSFNAPRQVCQQQCNSLPCQPAPCQPAPCHPAPCQAAPCQPAPSQPSPCQHSPCQPAPCQHSPCHPAPCQPSPCQPPSCTPRQPPPCQPRQPPPCQPPSCQPRQPPPCQPPSCQPRQPPSCQPPSCQTPTCQLRQPCQPQQCHLSPCAPCGQHTVPPTSCGGMGPARGGFGEPAQQMSCTPCGQCWQSPMQLYQMTVPGKPGGPPVSCTPQPPPPPQGQSQCGGCCPMMFEGTCIKTQGPTCPNASSGGMNFGGMGFGGMGFEGMGFEGMGFEGMGFESCGRFNRCCGGGRNGSGGQSPARPSGSRNEKPPPTPCASPSPPCRAATMLSGPSLRLLDELGPMQGPFGRAPFAPPPVPPSTCLKGTCLSHQNPKLCPMNQAHFNHAPQQRCDDAAKLASQQQQQASVCRARMMASSPVYCGVGGGGGGGGASGNGTSCAANGIGTGRQVPLVRYQGRPITGGEMECGCGKGPPIDFFRPLGPVIRSRPSSRTSGAAADSLEHRSPVCPVNAVRGTGNLRAALAALDTSTPRRSSMSKRPTPQPRVSPSRGTSK